MQANDDAIALRDYLVKLADDPTTLGEFKLNRKHAIARSGLPPELQELLVHGDWQRVRELLRGSFGGEVDCIFLVV